jgi:hypothetical protein
MARRSEFVREDDVLDPDQQPKPGDKVDYDGTGGWLRGSMVTVVCVVGVLTLAALQPHARNHSPAGGPSAAPVTATYPH